VPACSRRIDSTRPYPALTTAARTDLGRRALSAAVPDVAHGGAGAAVDPSGWPSRMGAAKGRAKCEATRRVSETRTARRIDRLALFVLRQAQKDITRGLVGGANGAYICLACAELAVEILRSPPEG
jgi:mRNA-degrading endonuclease toxin of MazEF toxin-antitoxin module